MINQAIYDRAARLEHVASDLMKEFAHLIQAKDAVAHYSATKFQSLQVKHRDSCTIDAVYVNTTVRFQLFIGFKDNRPSGRVVCFNMYDVCDEPHYDVLGEFNFDRSGTTDMGSDDHGEIRMMLSHADEIIVAWLNKAIEQGPQSLAEAKN